MAGIGDLTFDLYGYAYALLSCLCQAAYLLVVEFQVGGVCVCGGGGGRVLRPTYPALTQPAVLVYYVPYLICTTSSSDYKVFRNYFPYLPWS